MGTRGRQKGQGGSRGYAAIQQEGVPKLMQMEGVTRQPLGKQEAPCLLSPPLSPAESEPQPLE